MLVLARQRDQTIVIGDDVQVTVVDIRGDKVRLGISAPREISVHRKEVYEEIRKANREAAQVQLSDVSNLEQLKPGTNGKSHEADPFLRAAIEEAQLSLAEGGLPIGSVLVREGQIIGRGHNRRVQHNDPMAHAEIDCLTHAGRQKTYRDTVLYSTLMPCHLCGGAVLQFGVPRVIVGESVNFPGSASELRQHRVEVVDLHNTECIEMMNRFVKEHPDLWHEDIGEPR